MKKRPRRGRFFIASNAERLEKKWPASIRVLFFFLAFSGPKNSNGDNVLHRICLESGLIRPFAKGLSIIEDCSMDRRKRGCLEFVLLFIDEGRRP
ncbi:MAG: hypothetical protein ACN6OC_05515 [Alcaligenes sp.]